MRKKIEDELISIGIYPNLKAFDYICMIVEKIIASDMETNKMIYFYNLVAKKRNTTASAVDRWIRNAISRCNAYSVNGTDKKLINSEFLYTLALNIKRGCAEDE